MMSKEWNKQKKEIRHIQWNPPYPSRLPLSHLHLTLSYPSDLRISSECQAFFHPLKRRTQTWAKEWQSKAPTTMSILNSKRKRVRSCQTNWKTKEQKFLRSSNSLLHIVNTFRFKIVKLRDYSEERFELWTRPCFGFEQNYHFSQYGLCNKDLLVDALCDHTSISRTNVW